MSTAAVAEKLVGWEQQNTRSRMLAYERVAARVGKSADWLRKLIRDGGSRVSHEVATQFDQMLIRTLESRIASLTEELEMARLRHAHSPSDRLGEIQAHLDAARALMAIPPAQTTPQERIASEG